MNEHWIPARIGDALLNVDTPALILDLNKFESNLARLMSSITGGAVRVRPHAKSHKCVEIARRQISAGAIGICCQKSSEAEPFLAGGIVDVLITNEVVGDRKTRQLAQLAARYPRAILGVCVDDPRAVAQLANACEQTRCRLDVYIELEVGNNRAGAADTMDVLAIARCVEAQEYLSLRGLHAYFGRAQHLRSISERRQAIAAAAAFARSAQSALLAAGLRCDVITGGGTGTFVFELTSGVYTEIQPGSYIFMDADYAKNEQDTSWPSFEQSLMILTTVMSRRQDNHADRATVDAGLKSFSTDSGPALPFFAGWQVDTVSDEHTVLHRYAIGPELPLGEKALLVPGHIDPTVNLHDWIVAVRGDRVEAVWPIEARGAVF